MTVKVRKFNTAVGLADDGGYQTIIRVLNEQSITHSNAYRNGHYVSGGQWDYTYNNAELFPVHAPDIAQTGGTYYKGSFVAGVAGANPDYYDMPANHGADAYNRMKPTKPNMNILNSIYELKDVPGMLQHRFFDADGHLSAKRYADSHLQLQFGILPLINDVRDFVMTHRVAQKRLKQLIRDNGKPVRRRTVITNSSFSSVTDSTGYGSLKPILVTQAYASVPTSRTTTTTTHKVWASARYRYWLPPGPRDIVWTTSMLARIYGAKATLSTIYKAIPWSWLIDWYTDLGQIISNLDAGVADRLAADYFYVMTHDETKVTSESHANFHGRNGIVPVTAVGIATVGAKRRGIGDAFGFATNPSTMNSMQLSILGAIGISKLQNR